MACSPSLFPQQPLFASLPFFWSWPGSLPCCCPDVDVKQKLVTLPPGPLNTPRRPTSTDRHPVGSVFSLALSLQDHFPSLTVCPCQFSVACVWDFAAPALQTAPPRRYCSKPSWRSMMTRPRPRPATRGPSRIGRPTTCLSRLPGLASKSTRSATKPSINTSQAHRRRRKHGGPRRASATRLHRHTAPTRATRPSAARRTSRTRRLRNPCLGATSTAS